MNADNGGGTRVKRIWYGKSLPGSGEGRNSVNREVMRTFDSDEVPRFFLRLCDIFVDVWRVGVSDMATISFIKRRGVHRACLAGLARPVVVAACPGSIDDDAN